MQYTVADRIQNKKVCDCKNDNIFQKDITW